MKEECATKFTILVVTYNSDWIDIKRTLDSAFLQDFKDFDVVIADDGSEENHREALVEYFKEKNFDNYSLVLNEENQGTVKNLISGLEAAKGRYVRDFGPGDLFYNSKSLARVYTHLQKTNSKGCFGLMRGYYEDDTKKLKTCRYAFPFDINAYRHNKRKRIKKNLVVFTDNIVGAVMCYERDFYLHYLEKISPYVKYLEDIFPAVAVLDGAYFTLFDDYLIWYECSGGVSTSGNKRFRQLLFKDRDRLNAYICKEYKDDDLVRLRRKLNKEYRIDSPYKRVLAMSLKAPSVLVWAFRHYIQVLTGAYDKKEDVGFLHRIIY